MTNKDILTEEKIFEAATLEFEEKGMDGARMQDIADRASINKSLLHYYFRTKEKLFEAVFDKLADKIFKRFAGIFMEDLPFEIKINRFFTEHISFMEKNPRLPMFILREINRKPELLDKFMDKIDLDSISNGMNKNLEEMNLHNTQIAHLMISIVSLSVFPIIAKPIIEGILDKQGISYKEFINQRKEFSPDFILAAIAGMRNGEFEK